MVKYLSREFNIGLERRSSLINWNSRLKYFPYRAQMNPIGILLYQTKLTNNAATSTSEYFVRPCAKIAVQSCCPTSQNVQTKCWRYNVDVWLDDSICAVIIYSEGISNSCWTNEHKIISPNQEHFLFAQMNRLVWSKGPTRRKASQKPANKAAKNYNMTQGIF